MTYVNSLGDVGRGDIAVAGGKAVGLGGLIQAGPPVPQGSRAPARGQAHMGVAGWREFRIHASNG